MKLFKSSTFQFLLLVLVIGYFFGVNVDSEEPLLTFKEWWLSCLDAAKIYVAKEMVVYGSDAFKERGFKNE